MEKNNNLMNNNKNQNKLINLNTIKQKNPNEDSDIFDNSNKM